MPPSDSGRCVNCLAWSSGPAGGRDLLYSSGDDCHVRAWAAADLPLDISDISDTVSDADTSGISDTSGAEGRHGHGGRGPAGVVLKPVFSYHTGHAGNVSALFSSFMRPLFFPIYEPPYL